jgi:hypothetical protein
MPSKAMDRNQAVDQDANDKFYCEDDECLGRVCN